MGAGNITFMQWLIFIIIAFVLVIYFSVSLRKRIIRKDLLLALILSFTLTIISLVYSKEYGGGTEQYLEYGWPWNYLYRSTNHWFLVYHKVFGNIIFYYFASLIGLFIINKAKHKN